MFLTTHAALGALVAEVSPDPITAFLFGFISHLLIDMVPHGDAVLYTKYKHTSHKKTSIAYVTIDAIVGILLVIWIYTALPTKSILARSMGITGGILPDLLVGLGEVVRLRFFKAFTRFHFYFHNFFITRGKDLRLHQGIVMQLFVLTVLIHTLARG